MRLRLSDVTERDLVPGGFVEKIFSGYGDEADYPHDFAYRDDARLRAEFVRRNAGSAWVRHWRADIDGVPVGFASLVFNASGDAVVESVVLLPDWRGRGLGRALFQAAIDMRRTCAVDRIFASVYGRNESPSARICIGLGMRATHRKHRIHSHRHDPAMPGSPAGCTIVADTPVTTYPCIHYLVDRDWAVTGLTDEVTRQLAHQLGVCFTDVLTGLDETDGHGAEKRLIFSMPLGSSDDG